jgi:predicted Zn-dependent protease
VRQVGDAIVRLSNRVGANHGGYHFEVLDSDEVNGVSGPGGYVLLTRGAVECCVTEDELAALIAHELAHVTQKHGEKTLRQGRAFQGAVDGLARTGAAAAGLDDGAFGQAMVRFFTQAVSEMSRTAVEHGYGRDLEFAADTEGTYLVYDVYYDHTALGTWLARQASTPHAHGGATHASAGVRAQAVANAAARYGPFQDPGDVLATRRGRFETSLGR